MTYIATIGHLITLNQTYLCQRMNMDEPTPYPISPSCPSSLTFFSGFSPFFFTKQVPPLHYILVFDKPSYTSKQTYFREIYDLRVLLYDLEVKKLHIFAGFRRGHLSLSLIHTHNGLVYGVVASDEDAVVVDVDDILQHAYRSPSSDISLCNYVFVMFIDPSSITFTVHGDNSSNPPISRRFTLCTLLLLLPTPP